YGQRVLKTGLRGDLLIPRLGQQDFSFEPMQFRQVEIIMVLGRGDESIVNGGPSVFVLTQLQIGIGEITVVVGQRKLGSGGAVESQALAQLLQSLGVLALRRQSRAAAEGARRTPKRKTLLIGDGEVRLRRSLRSLAEPKVVIQPAQMVKGKALAERMRQ